MTQADVYIISNGIPLMYLGGVEIRLRTEDTGTVIERGIEIRLIDGKWIYEIPRPMPTGKEFADMIEFGLRDH